MCAYKLFKKLATSSHILPSSRSLSGADQLSSLQLGGYRTFSETGNLGRPCTASFQDWAYEASNSYSVLKEEFSSAWISQSLLFYKNKFQQRNPKFCLPLRGGCLSFVHQGHWLHVTEHTTVLSCLILNFRFLLLSP